MARAVAGLGLLALLCRPDSEALVLLNRTRADGVGSARLVASVGRLDFEVFGFGSLEATEGLLEDCEEALKKMKGCSVLVDLRQGVGCSPRAVPKIIRFVKRHQRQLEHVAVVGPRPLMALARAICRATKLQSVAFFSEKQEAEEWCEEWRKGSRRKKRRNISHIRTYPIL